MNNLIEPSIDRSSVYLRVAVYIVFCGLAIFLSAQLLVWLFGYFLGRTLSQFLAAIGANWVLLRIYGGRRLADLGLYWNATSARHLGLGIAGGMGAATLTLAPPLLANIAQLTPHPAGPVPWTTVLFVIAVLVAGSASEEIMFRGYGFQMLLGVWGPFTTVFTVAAVFAALHARNPSATWLALGNTAGFGVLFGWAFLRTGDLWMPIGLHFGWNFTLPLFGVNVSGFTIRLMGHQMEWTAGPLWSGGGYGPEGSILTSVVLVALALFVWRAPVRNQRSEVFPCAP